jgi:hypothetical protein
MSWHPNPATNNRFRDILLDIVNTPDKDKRHAKALSRIATLAVDPELGDARTLDFISTLTIAAFEPDAFSSIIPNFEGVTK